MTTHRSVSMRDSTWTGAVITVTGPGTSASLRSTAPICRPSSFAGPRRSCSASTHKWKIAYMHHPMYSSGMRHGPKPPLRAALEPLFARTGVDVVFAGHEHFYERMRPQGGIVYIIQGGSAKLRKGNIRLNSEITAQGIRYRPLVHRRRNRRRSAVSGNHLAHRRDRRLDRHHAT